MGKFEPPNPLNAKLLRTVYAYGSPAGAHFGHILFHRDGRILGYSHPNEMSWRWGPENKLEIIAADGSVTCTLNSVDGRNWLGTVTDKKYPLSLNELFSAGFDVPDTPAIVISSIPKSGTYFLEAAFGEVGVPSSNLHLGNQVVLDYRKATDRQKHRDGPNFELPAPVELVTNLAGGSCVVGHFDDPATVQRIKSFGHHVVYLKRNLRDVVASCFRFYRDVTKPTDEIDATWRALPAERQFMGFMYLHAHTTISQINSIASTIPRTGAIRFEDLERGQLSDDARAELNIIQSDLAGRLEQAAVRVHRKPTSTYSGSRTNWKDYWSDDIEAIFVAAGLEKTNRVLGYS